MISLIRFCFAIGMALTVLGATVAIWPFASSLWASRPVFQAVIETGESAYSAWLPATASAMRVGLDVEIVPRFSAQELRRDGHGEQVGLYRFPLHYRARDQNGQLLIDQWVLIDATQQQTLRQDQLDVDEPMQLSVALQFDPFPVEHGQTVRVEALLLPDRVYGAELAQAELRVFRHPPLLVSSIRQGLIGISAGLSLMLLGLLGELLVPRLILSRAGKTTALATRSMRRYSRVA